MLIESNESYLSEARSGSPIIPVQDASCARQLDGCVSTVTLELSVYYTGLFLHALRRCLFAFIFAYTSVSCPHLDAT